MPDTTEVGQIAVRGQAIYDRRLRAVLEPARNGQFVAVDVDTEEYVVAPSGEEALLLAQQKSPGKLLFLARIGNRAADFHRGLH